MTGCSFVHENDTDTYYNKCRKDVFNMNESFKSHMKGPKYGTNAELLMFFYPLSANFTKWSNRLKQLVGNLPTNCLSVFDYFVGLALKRLTRASLSSRLSYKVYQAVPISTMIQLNYFIVLWKNSC